MSRDFGQPRNRDQRKTLWLVLVLNLAIACGFFVVGVLADSSALIANGLDNSSDAIVYAISLVALSRPPKWKQNAARVSGTMLLFFAAGVLVDTGRRYFSGSEPLGAMIIVMAIIAAVVNIICLILLKRLHANDINLRAATTFSFNDFISNGGILIGGGLVIWTGQNWPDLMVGIAVALIAFYGGLEILRDASREAQRDQ